MTERPFPVRPLESMWRDDAWSYEPPCEHGKAGGEICAICDYDLLLAAARSAGIQPGTFVEVPPEWMPQRDLLSRWIALIIVAAMAALVVGGVAWLLEVIGL